MKTTTKNIVTQAIKEYNTLQEARKHGQKVSFSERSEMKTVNGKSFKSFSLMIRPDLTGQPYPSGIFHDIEKFISLAKGIGAGYYVSTSFPIKFNGDDVFLPEITIY